VVGVVKPRGEQQRDQNGDRTVRQTTTIHLTELTIGAWPNWRASRQSACGVSRELGEPVRVLRTQSPARYGASLADRP
jgi:hypothetical protein